MLDTFKKATSQALEAIREEMLVRRTNEVFLLFVMGSQFDHLIYQRMAKLGIFVLVADPASVTVEDVKALAPTGIIISGGPASVHAEPPPFDERILDLGIPVFGICLGFQMWAQHVGAQVIEGERQELGVDMLILDHTLSEDSMRLFQGVDNMSEVLQSHGDRIVMSSSMTHLGFSRGDVLAAGSKGHLYGVQFHPECSDTRFGEQIFSNFAFGICGAKDRFPAEDVGKRKIAALKARIGDKKVLLALSGGSDSSVAAYLLKYAIGDKTRLTGVYIKGIDRPDDEAFVLKYFGNQDWITLKIVDATERFLRVLSPPRPENLWERMVWWWRGIKIPTTMKEKRVAMRSVYKPVLEEMADEEDADFIGQGTLYTDISESGGGHSSGARKAQIKLHHNTNLGFSLPELTPLDDCVKDDARSIGRSIGVPEELLVRHPFPGPGLVVRIEGEITRERLAMARQLDDIYIGELRAAGLYTSVWQAGVVVTHSVHTYSKGDDAGSGPVIAYWAVWSVNGFTAQAADIPFEFRKRLARRFGNEVRGIGAVTYRDSDKPFSTIEWG